MQSQAPGEMSPRPKRRINKRKMFTRTVLLAACVYLVVMLVNIVIYQEKAKAEQLADEAELTQQIEDARVANDELRQRIEFAQTSAYMERMAREQLGYVGEDEIKFIEGDVPSNPQMPRPAPTPAPTDAPEDETPDGE